MDNHPNARRKNAPALGPSDHAVDRDENSSNTRANPISTTGGGAVVGTRGGLIRPGEADRLLLARVTQRSADSIKLAPGAACFASIKSMAVARDHVTAPASERVREALDLHSRGA